MLTYEQASELFSYDPETGALRWRSTVNSRAVAGATAGARNNHGYLKLQFDHRPYTAHRVAWLIMTGEWPDLQVDHINGKRDDNRWANLRLASQVDNSRNQARPNKTGFKGVTRKGERYIASIRKGAKVVHLGMFDTAQAAHAAWLDAAKVDHGEFVRAS